MRHTIAALLAVTALCAGIAATAPEAQAGRLNTTNPVVQGRLK